MGIGPWWPNLAPTLRARTSQRGGERAYKGRLGKYRASGVPPDIRMRSTASRNSDGVIRRAWALPRVFMKSLCRRSRFHIETLHGGALDGARSARRAFMLDVAFIALGFVVIGLMATYAAGLPRL